MSSISKAARPARLGWLVAALAALALLAAACSGGASSSGGGYGAAPTPTTSSSAGAVVDLRASKLGRILVDGQGRTLYLFEADKAGKSACNGPCASAWPPYLSAGAPKAGMGVTAALLGTSVRVDDGGGTQVTYHGHPLYYYAGDREPGDTTGQGLDQFGAKWDVVSAAGNGIDSDSD